VGSDILRDRLQALRPDVHIFGHTHFAWDATISLDEDGVNAVHGAPPQPAPARVAPLPQFGAQTIERGRDCTSQNTAGTSAACKAHNYDYGVRQDNQAEQHRVRFIQAPLCYPAERKRRLPSISMQVPSTWAGSPSLYDGCHAGVASPAAVTAPWLPLLLAKATYTLVEGNPSKPSRRRSSGEASGHDSSTPLWDAKSQARLPPCLLAEAGAAGLGRVVDCWDFELCPEVSAAW
jgi:hypothetical protein